MKEYKDSFIRAIFKNPEKALKLYSDITGKVYSQDTVVEMKILNEVILSKLRNDIAFIIDGVLIVILEHQSTLNKNMPLRILQYILVFYEVYFKLGEALYKEKQIKLPKPEFYMLYNGIRPHPDVDTLRLSDAFMDLAEGEIPSLELVVKVVNINYDRQSELLNKNKDLREYSYFVSRVRDFQKSGMTLQQAIRQAVKECLREGILAEILKQHEGEVDRMFSLIYDEELAMKYAKEEAREDGLEEGLKISTKIIQALKENIPIPEIEAKYNTPAHKIKELQSLLAM